MLLNLKDNSGGYGYTRRLSSCRCVGYACLPLTLADAALGLHSPAAFLQLEIH